LSLSISKEKLASFAIGVALKKGNKKLIKNFAPKPSKYLVLKGVKVQIINSGLMNGK
jgi:hypothetical protein